jgi:hypothetical protein
MTLGTPWRANRCLARSFDTSAQLDDRDLVRNKTLRLRIKAPPGRASCADNVVEYTF